MSCDLLLLYFPKRTLFLEFDLFEVSDVLFSRSLRVRASFVSTISVEFGEVVLVSVEFIVPLVVLVLFVWSMILVVVFFFFLYFFDDFEARDRGI